MTGPGTAEPDMRLPDGRRVLAGAVLLHPDGRVLLQLRDDKPGIESPGRWSLFGGGMDESETPEEGMLREVEEEIGFRVSHHRPLLVFDGWHGKFHIYLAAIGAPLEDLTLTEGAAFAYWEVDAALAEPKLTGLARVALEALKVLQRQRKAWDEGAELVPGAGY